jgi:hypothetical protein
VPARILPGDQHRQLERLAEADPADRPGRRLSNWQVPVLDCPAENGAEVPCEVAPRYAAALSRESTLAQPKTIALDPIRSARRSRRR